MHPPIPSEAPPPEIAALADSLRAAVGRAGAPVQCAWLFGSTARGEAGPLSDVDVAVLLDDRVAREDSLWTSPPPWPRSSSAALPASTWSSSTRPLPRCGTG